MHKFIFLILAIVVFSITACSDGPENLQTNPTQGILTNFALIDVDRNFALVDQSCWDWYPEGDGVYYELRGATSGYILTFPIREVKKGSALIKELGPIKNGNVIYVRESGGIRPIFKIVQIDPALGGVQIAVTGDVKGTCNISSKTS